MYSVENKSEESHAIQNSAGKHMPTAQFKDKRSQTPNVTEISSTAQLEKKENLTGMPDNLKEGIESLSGFSMDEVRVHYNSSKPATVQALAYTQGTDIHVAPGQEKHLPHEAWHVAQQMAGRVSPTTNINGMPVNDNVELEREADLMGEKAVQCKMNRTNSSLIHTAVSGESVQRDTDDSQTDTSEIDADEVEVVDVVPLPNMEKVKPDCFIFYHETESKNKHIKKDADRLKKRRSKNRSVREADLMSDKEGNGEIKNDESIIIVSHGSRLNGKNVCNEFAGYNPDALAGKIYQKITNNSEKPFLYQGEIFLDGCYTGEPQPQGKLFDGSSYAERFGQSLLEWAKNDYDMYPGKYKLQKKPSSFTVKGNLGAAMTSKDGRELVELDSQNRSFFESNIPHTNHPYRYLNALHDESLKKRKGSQFGGSMGKVKYVFNYNWNKSTKDV